MLTQKPLDASSLQIRDDAIILVVDDVLENLRLLSRILNRAGYKVRQAINGEMALRTVRSVQPDLILLDVMMPELDGYEVCMALKSAPLTQNIPIIFVSAMDEVWDKVKAFKMGASDYITKPFHHEEVLARVENQLQIHHLSQQLKYQNFQLQASESREREKAMQLEKALFDLQRTQAQLIQTEKMASLGQLVAGIAHEINNPLNFISGNLSFIQNYFYDVLKLLHAYQETYPQPNQNIREIYEDIDFDFLVGDWQKLLESMNVGADRIYTIVRSLQTFSNLNTSKQALLDVHAILDRTLLMLQPRLKQAGNSREIQVIKDYGTLPTIPGYDSQLCQVFMNIISNAIDALEDRFSQSERQPNCQACKPLLQETTDRVEDACRKKISPRIHINTEFLWDESEPEDAKNPSANGKVIVRISDNGCGISSAIKTKIFDPFFTTKEVGKGTGLGLSISYQIIVQQHEGKLYCLSMPGEGTEFIIEIPIAL